jgi:hypothetical protein
MALTYTSGFSVNNLKQKFLTREGHFNAEIQNVMREGAERIKEKSQQYVPVDTHNLEKAHKIIPGLTRAGYTSLSVEVSGYGEGSQRDRDVSSYASIIHEMYDIYVASGQWHPSEGTIAKMGFGVHVGSKFLERAVDEIKPSIIADCRKAIKSSF